MPSLISRVVVAMVLIIVCYVFYSNYITENTKLPEVKPPEQNITCSKGDLNCTVTNITGSNPAKEKEFLDAKFNGLYLHNPETDNLYLKRPNPDFNSTNPLVLNKEDPFLYYQAGKGICIHFPRTVLKRYRLSRYYIYSKQFLENECKFIGYYSS